MINPADPVTYWALILLVSVVMGTFLLIAVAFIRRWTQIRYGRDLHILRRQYRPEMTRLLAGVQLPAAIETLRQLSLTELELLLDPLFSRRKLTRQQMGFLKTSCTELGLIALWQRRAAGRSSSPSPSGDSSTRAGISDRSAMRHMLRAKSIRNLGKLRHGPSWPLLVEAVDDRRADVQWVALRSLATIGGQEGFSALCQRLHSSVQGASTAPPLRGLRAAMVDFDLSCSPSLLPSLRDPDRRLRLQAMEILQIMVCREADRNPQFTLTPKLLTPELVELLLTGLPVDTSAQIRAHTAEVIVFLADARVKPVMRSLLADQQWFVRLRAVRALSRLRHAASALPTDVRECLYDSHRRVRETAIHGLLSMGQEGKRQLYEHFLSSTDRILRQQIVELIEHTSLMSALVESYSAGKKGIEALMVEQFAGDVAPLGLASVLRTVSPEVRQKFRDRFLAYAEGRTRLTEETQPSEEGTIAPQPNIGFPPSLAA